ncbi:MAG: BsuBI/PstI family type II restriction endonuclease [Thiobacillus sp.]|nr:BsuBI/PstI family type II restriction endonuclease [Thiobacillus sp.]
MSIISECEASSRALQERFFPSSELIYRYGDQKGLEGFGVHDDRSDEMPDAIFFDSARNWLLIVDFATHRGLIDEARRDKLDEIFCSVKPELVYITVYPDRASMSKFPEFPAWGSHAWFLHEPGHMMHFNGSRFLGPYASG